MLPRGLGLLLAELFAAAGAAGRWFGNVLGLAHGVGSLSTSGWADEGRPDEGSHRGVNSESSGRRQRRWAATMPKAAKNRTPKVADMSFQRCPHRGVDDDDR
ncbi:hypothetical protein SDC9_150659 [bioreactor metagenome]|uniref:Uncharacterized protein n=1 Tax=bioreactor metagenome TaxID=1076179 RepID=A0A645EQK3_9ZZZZ